MAHPYMELKPCIFSMYITVLLVSGPATHIVEFQFRNVGFVVGYAQGILYKETWENTPLQ
jgi:hypothetical protein